MKVNKLEEEFTTWQIKELKAREKARMVAVSEIDLLSLQGRLKIALEAMELIRDQHSYDAIDRIINEALDKIKGLESEQ